jgi:hypothetical protein
MLTLVPGPIGARTACSSCVKPIDLPLISRNHAVWLQIRSTSNSQPCEGSRTKPPNVLLSPELAAGISWVERGIVRQRVGDVKTIYSGRTMAIDAEMIRVLRAWKTNHPVLGQDGLDLCQPGKTWAGTFLLGCWQAPLKASIRRRRQRGSQQSHSAML